MKDIKQQKEWEFVCGDSYNETWKHPEHGERIINKELCDFIVDQAIAQRDVQIVEMIKELREDCRNDGGIQYLSTYDSVINLITNK